MSQSSPSSVPVPTSDSPLVNFPDRGSLDQGLAFADTDPTELISPESAHLPNSGHESIEKSEMPREDNHVQPLCAESDVTRPMCPFTTQSTSEAGLLPPPQQYNNPDISQSTRQNPGNNVGSTNNQTRPLREHRSLKLKHFSAWKKTSRIH